MSKLFKIKKLNESEIELSINDDLIGATFDTEGLRTDLDGFLKEGFKECIINLSKVKYVDSSGLSILISILTKFRNVGGEVYLTQISDQVKKLLIITKLSSIFEVK